MNNQSKVCKNCTQDVQGKYCSNCGQKISTKRYAFSKYFLEHQLDAVLQLNRGLLFTIKTLFTKPGHAVRGYIQGKRVAHFNPFSLAILLVGVGFFIDSFVPQEASVLKDAAQNTRTIIENLPFKYPKLFMFLMVVLNAMMTWLWFIKTKHNFLENIIINIYFICGIQIIWFTDVLWLIFIDNDWFDFFQIIVSIAYFTWCFYQYFSVYNYSKTGLFLRSLASVFGWLIISAVFILIWKMIKMV